MPILAAIGGMAIPIALFAIMSYGTTYTAGAAIPMATDIAFLSYWLSRIKGTDFNEGVSNNISCR